MSRGALRLRPAEPADHAFLVSLAQRAFGVYGDYGRLIADWTATSGVETTVAEAEQGAAGFALLGFFASPASTPGPPRPSWVADLLAVAVEPASRGQGVGRSLVEHALLRCRAAARRHAVSGLRLSVAEENQPARRLFEAMGFEYRGGQDRFYPCGQRALHMHRGL